MMDNVQKHDNCIILHVNDVDIYRWNNGWEFIMN
jgi:hypothetical protein